MLRFFGLMIGWFFLQSVAAQSTTLIRIAAPDLSAGNASSYAGVVDVLHSQRLIEQALAKDNIKVQWFFFKGAGPAINEALASRQIDFAFLGDLPPIIGKSRGLDTQLLLATSRGISNYLAVRADLPIHSLAQIKGKKIGILRGTADELSLLAALTHVGLSSKDVRLINLDFNAVNAALAAKRIDASWGPARFMALRDKGIVKLPVNSKQLNGAGISQGVFLGRHEFIKNHPKQTQTIVNQVVKGLYWLSLEQNRQTQINLFAHRSAYPKNIYSDELNRINLKYFYSPLFDSYYRQQLQKKINLAQTQRLIQRPIDIQSWINPYFLNQALHSLKQQNYWAVMTDYSALIK